MKPNYPQRQNVLYGRNPRVAGLSSKPKSVWLLTLFLTLSASSFAAGTVSGTVVDESGEPLPGATIVIKGTTRGVITGMDGEYKIDDVPEKTVLVCSFIGFVSQEVAVNGQSNIDWEMKSTESELDEITVVAFGKQKKESVLASITAIKPDELKVTSSNLTTALAGRMSGLISYQRSGEPGEDNAEFFIRGVTTFGYKTDPLILIDGIELGTEDLARLNTDDIASFSIMKDATATALYGARGANGVILVTTKEGREGPARVSTRIEQVISMPTQNIDITDPITYMQLYNEAVKTRDPLGSAKYSESKIQNTILKTNEYAFPAVDWHKMLFKNYTANTKFNVNINGGGSVAQYYVAFSANKDKGILNVDKRNNFNNNIELNKYLLRSNVNIKLYRNTKMKVRMHGTFDDYSGPLDGGADVYNKVMRTSPVDFPAFYAPDEANKYTQHILFGGQEDAVNPYADMVKGYRENTKTLLLAQIELEHELDYLLKNLSFRTTLNTTRKSFFEASRSYAPFYYQSTYFLNEDKYVLTPLNADSGTEYLSYYPGERLVDNTLYMESALNYSHDIGDAHSLSGMLVYTMRESIVSGKTSLQESLAYRNMGLSGRFTYAYANKYFSEFNFGYNGSERFDQNHRFGFFPSAGLAWYASNEPFMQGIKKTVSKLKLKTTYGLVGNDAIGSSSDRFFYLSQVNLNDDNKGNNFGYDNAYWRPGININRYGNSNITWEISRKLNIGAELGLFDDVEIIADYFREDRSNILMDRTIPDELGATAGVKANVGEAFSHGFDISLDYQKSFSPDLWVTARGNFTYATSEFTNYEEPDYSDTPWLSKEGKSLRQNWGFVAERLFVDENEIKNAPIQFGEYMAGDIKYKDINEDGKITDLDKVPIGHPTTPEITYGFGISTGYKNFDLSCFFSGNARTSFWIDPWSTSPFADTDGDDGKMTSNALIQAYADSHWSEAKADLYALWPRLSNTVIENNNKTSTWFMYDGSFLRLKSLEIGYSLPENLIKKAKLDRCRFYVSGTNLLCWSSFKLWDPEMGGNGLGYPIQRQVSIGLNVNF